MIQSGHNIGLSVQFFLLLINQGYQEVAEISLHRKTSQNRMIDSLSAAINAVAAVCECLCLGKEL